MKRPRPGVAMQLFLRSARVQRKRAILTVAAIAWSCFSLLCLLAFGEGLKRQLYLGTIGMGSNLAVIWPGETGRPWRGLDSGRRIRPKVDDIELLRERVTGVQAIVGEMQRHRVSMTHGETTVNARLVGTNPEYGDIRHHFPQPGGRFIHHMDERGRRRVIFLGDELAEDIFGRETSPVGETLLVAGVPYRVIGVMKKRLQTGTYGGPDKNHAVIPVSTFRVQFGREVLSNIVVKPESPEEMPRALEGVARTLGARYGFDPEDERVLKVWDTAKTSAMMLKILKGMQIFLGCIGALTLAIGGVGVANIMYAVVKERTREIGVKMALGARRGWITGPLVLGCVGLLAGYFPARRAASIDPAETLRCG